MRIKHTMRWLALVALAPSAALAQTASTTLPKGFDATDGSTYRWAGWDTWASSSLPFVNFYQPARVIDIYNANAFPWDSAAAAQTITKLSLRKDAVYKGTGSATRTGASSAHSRRLRLYMSTDGLPANRPNWWVNELNHGSDKALVAGTTASTGYVTVNFPATPLPATGTVAPWNLIIPLTKPFIVPKGAKSLTMDWRHYGTDIKTGSEDRFRPDANIASVSRTSGSTSLVAGTAHCASPTMIEFSAFSSWPGNSLVYRVDTKRKNALTVGFIGSKLAAGVSLPGTGTTTSGPCKIFVNAFLFMVAVSANATNGRVQNVYGQIPAGAAGAKVAHQLLVFDAAAKGGLVTSRAVETTIGAGYLPTQQATTLYSYGSFTSESGARVDPDKELEPFFVSGTKGTILKIN